MSYVRRQRLSWARIKLSSYCFIFSINLFIYLINFFKINLIFDFNKSFSLFLLKFTFGTSYLGIWNNRFGFFSKGFIVYFSMYFFRPFFTRTFCIILRIFFFVKSFLKNFKNIFLTLLKALFFRLFSFLEYKKISNIWSN